MHEQRALGIARQRYEFGDRLEILARLLFIPGGFSRRELLQLENSTSGSHVAGDTARVAGTLGQEDRLHFGFEVVVIERAGLARLGADGDLAQQAQKQSEIERNF